MFHHFSACFQLRPPSIQLTSLVAPLGRAPAGRCHGAAASATLFRQLLATRRLQVAGFCADWLVVAAVACPQVAPSCFTSSCHALPARGSWCAHSLPGSRLLLPRRLLVRAPPPAAAPRFFSTASRSSGRPWPTVPCAPACLVNCLLRCCPIAGACVRAPQMLFLPHFQAFVH